mmetsp:Transcript_1823/g.3732  ORF Transcript_1823/g.3732 Transcript_1823/m.3732 type:complete len:419 (+) Transcript_1823:169-1425(+)
MDHKNDAAATQTTGDNAAKNGNTDTTATAPATAKNVKSNVNGGTASTSDSEDFLIFGARPCHLFDELSIAIDTLLAEEVATLPLLPRTTATTESSEQTARRSNNDDNKNDKQPHPTTGEEKLMSKLRKAYKRNLDLVEAYCARNIFTVQYHSKTKRRRILERYLTLSEEENGNDGEDGGSDGSGADGDGGGKSNNETSIPTLPHSKFGLPENAELPTPDQITGMDEEILQARQRLQRAKQRRIELKRQMERLEKASQPLQGVQRTLKQYLKCRNSNSNTTRGDEDGATIVASIEHLREFITKAKEGHTQLGNANSRAEEVLQLLDKIKVEREIGKKDAAAAAAKEKEEEEGREENDAEEGGPSDDDEGSDDESVEGDGHGDPCEEFEAKDPFLLATGGKALVGDAYQQMLLAREQQKA